MGGEAVATVVDDAGGGEAPAVVVVASVVVVATVDVVGAVGAIVVVGLEVGVGSETSVEVVVPTVEEVAVSGPPSAWSPSPSPLLQAAAVINTAKTATSSVLKPIRSMPQLAFTFAFFI